MRTLDGAIPNSTEKPIFDPNEQKGAEEKTYEKRVEINIGREGENEKAQKIVFITGASINLLYHVSAVYGLTKSTREYGKRPDILADKPDDSLMKVLQDETKTNFENVVKDCIEEGFQTPEDMINHFSKGNAWQQSLAQALEIGWNTFYKTYWENSGVRLTEVFDSVVEENGWVRKLKQMEDVVGKHFQGNYYLLAVEATGQSADAILPNVSIGTIRNGGDFGFDHEGFHLLLQERWAKDPRIEEIINDSSGWHDEGGWGSAWKRKIEQAIVVSLDSLLNNHDEGFVAKYFQECNVGEWKDIFYPKLKEWLIARRTKDDSRSLTDAIYEIINSNQTELVQKHIRSGEYRENLKS